MNGFVSIVGAGPGDPDLITVRGLTALRKAEVLIYDNLIHHALIEESKENAEKIYVGKGDGWHILPQEDINALLIRKANEGKRIARLKGGDPYVFGRGGEEAFALKKAHISFEIIPGVTSGIAVPMYAGIPLTYRGISSSFTCVTGHGELHGKHSAIHWENLAKGADTLVIYMGFKNLSGIVEILLMSGKSPATPIALIQQGTLATQKTITGNLDTIVMKVKEAQLEPPVIIVIGNVVQFHGSLL